MSELTYEDFKQRINIQEVLQELVAIEASEADKARVLAASNRITRIMEVFA